MDGTVLRSFRAIFLAAAVCLPVVTFAQSVRAFDVASIKASDPKDNTARFDTLPGGRIIVRNLTLKFLIQYAWNVRDFELFGAPAWLEGKYDIDAKTDGAAELSDAELKVPLQALLTERLNMTVHREARDLPVYSLVMAAGGPKLVKSADDAQRTLKWTGRSKIVARKITMKILAGQLSTVPELQRNIIDDTGLEGNFDVTLEWSPEVVMHDMQDVAALPSAGPSLFTALTEQLGLKLVAKKGTDQVLVIDHIEQPSTN